jgi:hypothetical protein
LFQRLAFDLHLFKELASDFARNRARNPEASFIGSSTAKLEPAR